jgi:hypothetical protein
MTHICGIGEKTKLHDIWLSGSQRLIGIKPILSYNICKTFLSKFYLGRAKITPIHYILAGM